MKHIRYIVYTVIIMCCFTACETYGDYDIEYSSIHPLGGMYRIYITDESGATVTPEINPVYCYLANTVNNSTTECWIRVGEYSTSGEIEYSINGKINCELNSLTFSGSNIENLAGNVISSTETFSVTDGKLVLKGETAPSGATTDKISFIFTNSRFPGKTYTATGYRYTGWSGD